VILTFFDRLAAGCLRKQPTGGEGNRRLAVLEKILKKFRINRQLRSPIFFRGHLTPLSRRSYQPENRFSSVSRPFLNVSGAASLLSTQARIYQTTTIGPAGLYC
jgi:hypothetical protein